MLLKQKEEKHKENKKKISEAKSIIHNLEDKIKELKSQIQVENDKLDQLKQEKENNERKLKQEKESLEIAKKNLENDLETLSNNHLELEKNVKSIEEELNVFEKDIKKTEAEINEIIKKDNELSKELTSLKDVDKITTLASKLSSNDPSLKEINLTGQQIMDEDVSKIMKSLVKNKILTKLILKQNPITGEKFVDDLLNVLRSNNTLETLSFEKCSISRSVIDKILKVIPENKGLIELYLGENERDSDLDITEEILDRNFKAKE